MNQKRERERRGVGLGGRHLAEQRNNQIIDGVSGGGAMEERSDLGGTCGMTPCHRSSRQIDQQIIKEKIRRDLKWPPNDANTHNNQPNTTRRDGGGIQEDTRLAGSAGGVQCDRFGCDRAQLM